MNTFAEIKTAQFQKGFVKPNIRNLTFEMKIDDKNQIFNRLIYHHNKNDIQKSNLLIKPRIWKYKSITKSATLCILGS